MENTEVWNLTDAEMEQKTSEQAFTLLIYLKCGFTLLYLPE